MSGVDLALNRRTLLRSSLGLLGLSLPDWLSLQTLAHTSSTPAGFGRARSCIVLFCWGGQSHLDTWDLKPDAPVEIRGQFRPIHTTTPGILVGEHLPLLARQTRRLAIVRSMHHGSAAHGKGMYWNLTGHPPAQFEAAVNQPPSRQDWPSLGAMVSRFRRGRRGLPAFVQLPYPFVDNMTLQAGEGGGWLGPAHDPFILRTPRGKAFGGVSRDLGAPVFDPAAGVDPDRLTARAALAAALGTPLPGKSFDHFQQMSLDMLTSGKVRAAFDLDREPLRIRAAYGDHIGGQSALLARRLTEVGVPFVTVLCAAGDLNGSAGDHWDTHGDNFNRLKNTMLPTFDRAASVLIDDLADRGRLDETLVVVLTEFGRTPRVNGGAGRDHYPNCYTVVLAGGGVRGGRVYGRSDSRAAEPADSAAGPADLHATVFHALGIPPDAQLTDPLGRVLPLTDGRVLPLF